MCLIQVQKQCEKIKKLNKSNVHIEIQSVPGEQMNNVHFHTHKHTEKKTAYGSKIYRQTMKNEQSKHCENSK